MRIYVDEDTASALLVQLLGKAGHDVQVPAEAGRMRSSSSMRSGRIGFA
jgi:hypothetical protein